MKKTLLIASLLVISSTCHRNPDNRDLNPPNMRGQASDRIDQKEDRRHDQQPRNDNFRNK